MKNPSSPDQGLSTSFTPKPTHPPYQKFTGGRTSPSLPFSYTVKAFLSNNSTISGQVIIQQTQTVDIVVQEYINHAAVTSIEDGIAKSIDVQFVPGQSVFGPPVIPPHFNSPVDLVNGGNYPSLMINDNLSAIVEAIRTSYNMQFNNPTPSYELIINSAYRNPERNERVGGSIRSVHQFGKAVDLVPAVGPPNSFSAYDLYAIIVNAALNTPGVTLARCDNSGTFVRCDGTDVNGPPNHVHVEF